MAPAPRHRRTSNRSVPANCVSAPDVIPTMKPIKGQRLRGFRLESGPPATYISPMRTTLLLVAVLVTACSKEPSATKEAAKPVAAGHLGAPISSSAQVVSLAQVVKNPDAYKGKSLVTTGTVTAVCQQMGCW